MIHVLSLVSYPFLPARVGGEKAIAHFYRHLSSTVSLTCVTTKKNDPRAAQGYEVLNILSNSRLRYGNISYYFLLKKFIRENNITHLLIEHPYYGWLAVWLKWSTGVKLIVRSHNIEGLRWKTLNKWWWKILWKYERWTHCRADYNLFIQDADLQYAVRHFRLQREKCLLMTYGLDESAPPSQEERIKARKQLIDLHSIPPDNHILLFNGAFNYPPNLNGLKNLLTKVNPVLQQQAGFQYKLIICGKEIPPGISNQHYPNTIFAGFVDDISIYFLGTDIFLNPLTEGGGIKTKLVEALGAGANAASTRNGAIGVDPAICNGKLIITEDHDWNSFASSIMQLTGIKASTPPAFFDHFYWGHIVEKTVQFIKL